MESHFSFWASAFIHKIRQVYIQNMKILVFFHNTIYSQQWTHIPAGEAPPHHQTSYAKLHGLFQLVLAQFFVRSVPIIFFAVKLKSIYFGLVWPYNSFPVFYAPISMILPKFYTRCNIFLSFFCLTTAIRPILCAVHSLIGLPIAIAASFGIALVLTIMRRYLARAARTVSNLGRDLVCVDALLFPMLLQFIWLKNHYLYFQLFDFQLFSSF